MNTNLNKPLDFKKEYRFLKAEEIIPADDAFHGNINLLDIEWWYFDAVFDNGYSIHIGIRTYHIRNNGVVQSRINIYKDGKTEVELKKQSLFSNFSTSKEKPLIKINDLTVIKFDYNHYKKTGEWKYYVTLNIKDCSVDLTFIGTTRGWKIETQETCWAVGLPKATVTGTINFHGKKMNVKGIGYHDHNWSYSPTTVIKNLGWYWGRITADNFNLTWANTVQTSQIQDLISVVNQDKKISEKNQEFFSIQPKNIKFIQKDYKINHRRKIPTTFILKFEEKDTKTTVKADIKIDTVDIQYSRIFIIHYWRYHVKTTGAITIGSKTEILNEKPQIIEYLSFKS